MLKVCPAHRLFVYSDPLMNIIHRSGEFLAMCSVPPRTLTDTVTTITGEEKEQFLRFIGRILQWLPEQRATATDLLDDTLMLSL
jgi:hypothetical protein